MAAKKARRRQYFISRRFQLKYIAHIIIVLYIGAAVAGYTVYWSTWVTLGEKLANVYPRGRLVYIFRAANWLLFWRIILITPIFAVVGTFLSHRIVGPIYRLGTYTETLIKGDYSRPLKLRKHDEMKEVAAKLTVLCANLREKSDRRREELEALLEDLASKNVSEDILNEIRTRLSEPENLPETK